MRRAEVEDGVWTIPQERYKTGLELVIPLSDLATGALARLPKIGKGEFFFTSDGVSPLSGYSKAKAKFDKQCGVSDWTLHDLRRTARSLMSRAGVSADVGERWFEPSLSKACAGHMTGMPLSMRKSRLLRLSRRRLSELWPQKRANVVSLKVG